jgi:hypothetical protein
MYPEVYTFKELVLKIGSIPKSTSMKTTKIFHIYYRMDVSEKTLLFSNTSKTYCKAFECISIEIIKTFVSII